MPELIRLDDLCIWGEIAYFQWDWILYAYLFTWCVQQEKEESFGFQHFFVSFLLNFSIFSHAYSA